MSASQIADVQAALGPAWQALIRQQYVIGIQQCIAAAVLGLLTVMFAIMCLRFWKWQGSDFDKEGYKIGAIALFVLSVITVLFSLGLTLDGVGHIINPVGYAVQGIINGVTSHAS